MALEKARRATVHNHICRRIPGPQSCRTKSLQCTVLAAAVIGSFSWTTIEEAYWLTHGFWHSSLIFSVLGILLSASEVTVLHQLGPLLCTGKQSRDYETLKKYYPLLMAPSQRGDTFSPRLKMIFTWQAPLMFMSYSVCAFLVGLTVLVCTPLIRDRHNWTAGHSVRSLNFFCDASAKQSRLRSCTSLSSQLQGLPLSSVPFGCITMSSSTLMQMVRAAMKMATQGLR